MSDGDDAPPPLEDMTVLVDRIKEKSDSKQVKSAVKLDDKKTVPKPSSSFTKQKSLSNATGYGGMKKGFLFGNSSGTTKSSKKKLTENKKIDSEKLHDFVVKPKSNPQSELVIDEVQQAMNDVKTDFLKNKEAWLTDDLLKNIENNDKLLKQLSDPKFSQAIQWMQRDPKAATEYYKNDADVQNFFKEFYKVLGNHFTSLGDGPTVGVNGNKSSSSGVKTEEEKKMDEILANPEIREILSKPDIQGLFTVLRNNPEEGQKLFHSSDSRLKADVQKLVAAGLLNFESNDKH